MENKILFCGSNVPDKIEYSVKEISAAGNRFQNNMISNMLQMKNQVTCLSYIGMKISTEDRDFLYNDELLNQNHYGRKYVFKGRCFIQATVLYHKFVRDYISDTDIAMCYNSLYVWLGLPYLTRKYKKRSILILADYSDSHCFNNPVRKLYANLQLISIRKFDMVVGLSSDVKNALKPTQKFILMEGGIDENLYRYFTFKEKRDPNIIKLMYSGLLSQVTGVDLLLNAFLEIKNPDLRLIITGKGDLEELVCESCKKDSRIEFKGHLDYSEYLNQLQESDILINPRNMDLPENRNNFPSKIMDYFASGKVIISTKFTGWEKFTSNINFCNSGSENLKNVIEKTVNNYIPGKNHFVMNRELAHKYEWRQQIARILEG